MKAYGDRKPRGELVHEVMSSNTIKDTPRTRIARRNQERDAVLQMLHSTNVSKTTDTPKSSGVSNRGREVKHSPGSSPGSNTKVKVAKKSLRERLKLMGSSQRQNKEAPNTPQTPSRNSRSSHGGHSSDPADDDELQRKVSFMTLTSPQEAKYFADAADSFRERQEKQRAFSDLLAGPRESETIPIDLDNHENHSTMDENADIASISLTHENSDSGYDGYRFPVQYEQSPVGSSNVSPSRRSVDERLGLDGKHSPIFSVRSPRSDSKSPRNSSSFSLGGAALGLADVVPSHKTFPSAGPPYLAMEAASAMNKAEIRDVPMSPHAVDHGMSTPDKSPTNIRKSRSVSPRRRSPPQKVEAGRQKSEAIRGAKEERSGSPGNASRPNSGPIYRSKAANVVPYTVNTPEKALVRRMGVIEDEWANYVEKLIKENEELREQLGVERAKMKTERAKVRRLATSKGYLSAEAVGGDETKEESLVIPNEDSSGIAAEASVASTIHKGVKPSESKVNAAERHIGRINQMSETQLRRELYDTQNKLKRSEDRNRELQASLSKGDFSIRRLKEELKMRTVAIEEMGFEDLRARALHRQRVIKQAQELEDSVKAKKEEAEAEILRRAQVSEAKLREIESEVLKKSAETDQEHNLRDKSLHDREEALRVQTEELAKKASEQTVVERTLSKKAEKMESLKREIENKKKDLQEEKEKLELLKSAIENKKGELKDEKAKLLQERSNLNNEKTMGKDSRKQADNLQGSLQDDTIVREGNSKPHKSVAPSSHHETPCNDAGNSNVPERHEDDSAGNSKRDKGKASIHSDESRSIRSVEREVAILAELEGALEGQRLAQDDCRRLEETVSLLSSEIQQLKQASIISRSQSPEAHEKRVLENRRLRTMVEEQQEKLRYLLPFCDFSKIPQNIASKLTTDSPSPSAGPPSTSMNTESPMPRKFDVEAESDALDRQRPSQTVLGDSHRQGNQTNANHNDRHSTPVEGDRILSTGLKRTIAEKAKKEPVRASSAQSSRKSSRDSGTDEKSGVLSGNESAARPSATAVTPMEMKQKKEKAAMAPRRGMKASGGPTSLGAVGPTKRPPEVDMSPPPSRSAPHPPQQSSAGNNMYVSPVSQDEASEERRLSHGAASLLGISATHGPVGSGRSQEEMRGLHEQHMRNVLGMVTSAQASSPPLNDESLAAYEQYKAQFLSHFSQDSIANTVSSAGHAHGKEVSADTASNGSSGAHHRLRTPKWDDINSVEGPSRLEDHEVTAPDKEEAPSSRRGPKVLQRKNT